MKRYAGIILLVVSICFIPSLSTDAHVVKTDGEITASLHIDPADNPIAGDSASLIFLFDDETNRFRTTICDCRVTISSAENPEEKLFDRMLPRTGVLSFTFPSKGIYTVTLDGTPKQGFTFQNIHTSFDIRVDRDAAETQSESIQQTFRSILQSLLGEHTSHFIMLHLFHLIIFGIGIIACTIVIVRDSR